MAAGQGKRMHSARPKVLHRLAGEPIVAHVLAAARSLAPTALAVVVGHGADAVRAALHAPDLTFVAQDPPRGTGDAVRVALAALPHEGVTVVANGDCPLVRPATFRALAERAARGRLAVLTARVADPGGLGRVVRNADGSVARIVEARDATEAELALDEIYTGVLAAPTALLAAWVARLAPDNAQREYYLTDVVKLALADTVDVEGVVLDDAREAAGINDRAQLAAAEALVRERRTGELMARGVTLADPLRTDVRGELACGRDVAIDVGCVFEGRVTLGDDVEIGAYCVLRDVALGAGTRVLPFSHLDGATLGAHCIIGPYARLRPGAQLADDVHIGNFVEVKAATIGTGSKANHLAYIGDATVGAGVNYGAGAITANYDGARKHRTVIGDNVHVGSNSVLVAPVEVEPGATIGGGSVITEKAPADTLTLTRAPQVSVKGWVRPRKERKEGGS
ncbi:MAG: bifunctional UDP-N-acetylglucosamine diphosphorylase/glucosamine-1-phosphate N-acetyltransferase GlmU [Proteobacteria bacterium]|nr:bifunctional UDP-N-acetylglucosamine diphosphorylase/glucosamine-1-phosphate N-acetyltransferase GlmU [Pseudomonadota bacterium]